ncbi:tissue alpha-L-fucosidase-like [Oppia nitens]|uniref:tissue alpha-L-fucosidase-like n=1 Tax=Oppia nitens TaxID=1686743 RepID=UPI0023DC7EE2|nr:tissue alpha-L-fucosidase-like [Oppia nitens]
MINILCKTILLLVINQILFVSVFGSHNNNNTFVTKYEANWASLDTRPLPVWYDRAKIGIFIHWGVYCVPSYMDAWFWFHWRTDDLKQRVKAVEDFMSANYPPNWTYQDFAKDFTAEFFDANHWADVFKASGAKYVVLTTKHHEGYTLWPSNYSFSWNARDVGPNRDLVGELSKSVKTAGLKFGTYHSLIEWFHPLYKQDVQSGYKTQRFVDAKVLTERHELVDTYLPDLIWSDNAENGDSKYWKSEEFLAWLYNESPIKDTVVVNDRWGVETDGKHGGYYNYADNYNPKRILAHKWERAMDIGKGSWGYRRNVQLNDYMTDLEIITAIAETVSCGGNILLSIGPTKEGTITPIYEERLRKMGDWLQVNGEAIYDSHPWTQPNDTTTTGVWYTQKGKAVYAIVLFWPKDNTLVLGSVQYNTVDTIQMLGVAGNLNYKAGTGGHSLITFPYINPRLLTTAYVLKINIK